MDWATLPPEINSARMYAGPGATSLIQAAVAWETLAAELSTTSESFSQVVAGLTSVWRGSGALSMRTAALTYQAWLMETAATAQGTARQGMAAAAAYEAAFAATVPPPAIAENRARLTVLVATNFLGINTPAIMATEAQYMEMWAQDALAMYGYEAGSSAARRLTPFTPLTTLTTGVPTPAISIGAGAVQNALGSLQGLLPQSFGDMAAAAQVLTGLGSLAFAPVSAVLDQGLFTPIAAQPDAPGTPEVTGAPAGGISAAPSPVSASVGYGKPVGGLTVPRSWPAPSNNNGFATPLSTDEFTGIPGVPLLGATQKKDAEPARYGFRPTRVIPRHPSAG